MRPGDRWTLFIPAELGYGSSGAGGKIPGGATLIFDLELISLTDPSEGFFGQLGLPMLDDDFIGPLKVWMVVLAVGAWLLYNLFSGGGGGGKKVSASHILVKTAEEASSLKEQLAGGADFASLAKAHSTCPSGKKGGSLGTFSPGQMVPAFDKVCWSAPVGEIQGPVETQFGHHLILVTERSIPGESKVD